MPITDCPVHGESGCIEMCEHLAADLDRGVYSSHATLPVYTIRMCDGCFEEHGIQEILGAVPIKREAVDALRAKETGVRSIGPDYLFEAAILERDHPEQLVRIRQIYGKINETSRLRCSGCIDRVQVDHARRTGTSLPFEPFEHTLVNNDDDRIDALRLLLLDRMSPRGNHGEAFYGVRLFAGSALRPLSIRIYGVTDEEDQQSTLQAIEQFFDQEADYQRSVQFFEPIRWVTTTTKEGTRRTRIPDVLLLDVVVR